MYYNSFFVNFPCILVTLLYAFLTFCLLGMSLYSLAFVIGIYLITLIIAFNSPGERILSFLLNVRRPMTQKEKDYLYPLFIDVYNSLIDKNSIRYAPCWFRFSRRTNIFISDTMDINAFCIGSGMIVVTRGAINAFSEEQLKGIIAHEIGHIVNGNTKALLLTQIGNGLFSLCYIPIVAIFRLVEKGIKFIDSDNLKLNKINPILFIMNILKAVFNTLFLALNFLSGVILSANSRYCEFLADQYASYVGYGEELVEALYLLNDLSFNSNQPINKRLLGSHPSLARRIEKLEAIIYPNKKDNYNLLKKESKLEKEFREQLVETFHKSKF